MRKTALITGATSGIGLEFTKIFASRGADLLLVARNEKVLKNLKKNLEARCGINVHILPLDLSKEGSALKVWNYADRNELRVEYLINNAGFGDYGKFAYMDMARQRDMISLNCICLTELTRLFMKPMLIRHSGRILNVASIASFEAGPLMSTYYASKAYVLSFSEALREELAGSGVKVTALCPGPVKTNFEKNANLEGTGLFDTFVTTSAREVALAGFRGLMTGRAIVVPGWLNKLSVMGVKLVPRFVARKAVYRLQKLKTE